MSIAVVRTLQLPAKDHLYQLDPDSSDLDFRLASTCIFASRCDNASFHLICKGLGTDIIDCHGYSVEECLLASLCHHYHFPCQLKYSSPKMLASLEREDKQLLNSLICETIREDIVVKINCHLYGKRYSTVITTIFTFGSQTKALHHIRRSIWSHNTL